MLLKFAYDGTKFFGYQRQPSVPTVEGEILKVLKELGIDRIRSASRTDRGVSALGNVIQVKAEIEPKDLIGILNSKLRYIYFHSYSQEDVNPRHAEERWYRYHLIPRDYSLERLREVAKIFEGEHDFRNFTRVRKNTVLRINRIEVGMENGIITVDFFARNYLWNLIRRVMSAMIAYSRGEEFGDEIFEQGGNFGLAPPEPLILMDVRYNFSFKEMRMKRRLRDEFSNKFLSGMLYYYLSLGKL